MPVPGLEHREAAVAQAADHGPARPRYAKATGDEAHADRRSDRRPRRRRDRRHGTDVLDCFYNPEGGDFVIDEDVLWTCTSCGACVQQCPVDIEHVDHIMDMRRYQMLVESNFPAELNQLFKGWRTRATRGTCRPRPHGLGQGLDFDVPVVGEDLESLESVDWLFWVGCAGAYEDRAEEDDPRGRRAARHGRHLLRRPRQRRDLHR